MTWIAVAIGGAAIVGAVGSNMAANTQADAQKSASAQQLQMFNTINTQEQPFIQGGYAANTKLQDLLGLSGNTGADGYGSLTSSFTPADYLANKDPGYDFQLQTGAQATRNADTPGSGALSGAALKDLTSFNQGMAATGYQNAYNRFNTTQNNIFDRLSGIAGLGQNAATQVGTAGTSLGRGAAQATAAAGSSQAAGIVGVANNLGSGGIGLSQFLNSNNSGNTGGTDPAFNDGNSAGDLVGLGSS